MAPPARFLLRIDLTAETVSREPIPERWLRQYVGGKGLGAHYLYEELDPGTDPLGPENALLFVVGPLTGRAPGEPRYAAITKSPLTGAFLDSYSGGEFAGAVMGAKRLKAVVARGEPPAECTDLRKIYEERFADDDTGRWQAASETLESVDFADAVGALATRGWQENRFDGVSAIGIEAARAAATGREHEGAIPGGFEVSTEEGESIPRGATQMTLGAGLGIDEFDAVATLGARCDRLGIDVISAGNAVAWAIRASEAGLIERDLAFGDHEAARELLDEIAARETELGNALADGVEKAARKFGGEAFVPAIKGMELPAYDPRGARSMALAYATSDRGGCHRRARPIEDEPFSTWSDAERVERVIDEQDRRSVLWSLIVDDFVGEAFADLGAAWLSELGYNLSPTDLATLGERVWTLTRLFNVREGLDRGADRVPEALTRPTTDGDAIDPNEFSKLLDRYYAARGWDERGRPTAETIDRLNLATLDTP